MGDHKDRAGEGARADVESVYQAEFAYVLAALRRLGVAASDLEDVAHDVFVVVFRRWSDYDPARPVRPWLFGIAYRVAADRRGRASNAEQPTDAPPDRPDPGPGPEQLVAKAQARQLVHAVLATMELEQRAVFVMHDIDGHSAPEIAEALGCPLNTVYSRLRLAREKFERAVRAREAP